jgi:hypothetical protein
LRVDLCRLDLQHVAAGSRDEDIIGREKLPESGDLDVETVSRGSRLAIRPQGVDQPIARDDLVCVE